MLKSKLRKIVLALLLKLNQKKNNYPILLNINWSPIKEQKHVLLCYLDYVSSNIRLYKNATHTNFAELDVLVKVFIDADCMIDICSFEAEGIDDILAGRQYDYILGFQSIYRKAVEMHPNAKKILYVSENPYHISKPAEEARIRYYKERTGYSAELFRTGKSYKEDDLNRADAIICLGEKRHFEHLGIPVFHVTPTGLRNPNYQFRWDKKDKNSFLVFGCNGIIHKGIDILIEVFKLHPEWELYLCGAGTQKALKQYHLSPVPENIHLCGYVNTQSEAYIELVNRCVFVLLPSCSEACATSLLTCMCHGLIPITTINNGMEQYAKYCNFFDGFYIDEIARTIEELSATEMDELEKRAYETMLFSQSEFALPRFYRNIKSVLEQIM